MERTVTLNLLRTERSIKQHGYCKKDCSYFERGSTDPWCIQVYFLLIKLMSVLLHRVVQEAFCDKLLIHELLDFSLTSGVSCKLSDFDFY